MASEKITFEDKSHVLPYGTREIQVWDLDMNEVKSVVNSHADNLDVHTTEIQGLTDGQTGGLKSFTTLALLQAYATPNINDSYKVTNDATSSNNGYYHWVSGTTYVKDADLANGIIEAGNVDAVSGGVVYNKLDGYNISYDKGRPLYNFEFGGLTTSGDLVENTVRVRTSLIELKAYNIKTVLDYGSGRGNWHKKIYNDNTVSAF